MHSAKPKSHFTRTIENTPRSYIKVLGNSNSKQESQPTRDLDGFIQLTPLDMPIQHHSSAMR